MTQLFLTGTVLAAGLYFFLARLLKLPTMDTAKAMLNAGRKDIKAAKTLEAWLMSGAVKLSKYIRMDEYKRSRMANILKASGIGMTPEVCSACAITKAGAILLGVIPCLFLLPLLSPVLVILAVLRVLRKPARPMSSLWKNGNRSRASCRGLSLPLGRH
jgi:hypothetical protein